MNFSHRTIGLLVAILVCACAGRVLGSNIIMKDGRRIHGRLGKTTGLADNPQSNQQGAPATITLVDDDLRRIFVPTFQIQAVDELNAGDIPEKITIPQRTAIGTKRINRVGPIMNISPFDEYGRRVFTMNTTDGPLDIIQGITLITPRWTKVEGLLTAQLTPLVWDSRIATSSIPRDVLHKILVNTGNRSSLDARLRVVRLFLQAERYQDAEQELEGVIADFPDQQDLQKEVKSLHQLHARSIVDEIELRRSSGQHFLAYSLLQKFPNQDVAGETLAKVSEMLKQYEDVRHSRDDVASQLTKLVGALPDGRDRTTCEAIVKEMNAEMSLGNFDRLAGFIRLRDDKTLSDSQRLSIAISGWLLGADSAETNLLITASTARVRELIRRYMNEPVLLKRNEIEQELRTMEGASPSLVAKAETPGFYKLNVPIGMDNEPDATYYVQLPPEYDPYVRYPTIVTLNGVGSTPEQQVDWWAGAPTDNGQRLGQASRFGYIVIAVNWLADGQRDYGFTAREHATVLASLRDACRRFSINTDRVFLTGHSAGGDAAWDIGLAHPDLWAGVIPIVARTQKYASHYWPNASMVPFYCVGGELDGDKLKENARDLDRYMIHRYDVTVVEYQGRGHEDFYEEIKDLFDWMARKPDRNFFPKEFTVATMRTWDNYFWWLEIDKLPPRSIVEPVNWPPGRGTRAAEIRAKIQATGDIYVPGTGLSATIWFAPEMLNPGRDKVDVHLGGRRYTADVTPNLSVLLNDVRTRGDRQHPFWAKFQP
jgi:predicted esterase